jgi:hypothetical protein
VGSAFTAVTGICDTFIEKHDILTFNCIGFSLLASHYVDDVERGVAIGRVTSGVSLGAACKSPFFLKTK